MSLILCSHLLRDVERVCQRVIVLSQGRVAATGSIAELTGPRRAAFDVRFKGEPAALLRALEQAGCESRQHEDGFRVFVPQDQGPELIFRLAREHKTQVRHLRPGTESLEDVFLRALGHEVAG